MNPDRLKRAREKAGLSLRDLSTKIGNLVSAQALGKYERGEMAPSPKVASVIAAALDSTTQALEVPLELALESVEFRKKAVTSKREEARVKALVARHLEHYLWLEDRLGTPPGAHERTGRWPAEELRDAETAAVEVRSKWQLGSNPVGPLAELLEIHGLKVMGLPLPENVSGFTCTAHIRGRPPVDIVVTNSSHPQSRQRFTWAHELGHKCLECTGQVDVEKLCNRFASAFLAPRALVVEVFGVRRRALNVDELMSAKRALGISMQALIYRCRDLGVIGESTYSELFIQFSRLGWRKKEPGDDVPGEMSTRFERLCHRAVAEGILDENLAKQWLGEAQGAEAAG